MVLDIIVLALLTLLAWQGAARGFLQSVIGPIAFLIATGIALIYYNLSKNIMVALGIGLVGPFFLRFFLVFVAKSFGKISGDSTNPSIVSSLLGGALTICWGMCFILPIMVALTLVPHTIPGFSTMHNYLVKTRTFEATQYIVHKTGILPKPAPQADTDEAAAQPAAAGPIPSIADDERIKALLNDPEIKKAAESKNVAALMSNPKILTLAQDPQFIKKVLALYGQIGTPAEKK